MIGRSLAFRPQAARAVSRGVLARWRARLFALDPEQATFRQRGFESSLPERQERLEEIGRTFIQGFNYAVETADPTMSACAEHSIPLEQRGFAYEGAAMGFALLDIISPRPRRYFQRFIHGPGNAHLYMAIVGAGWALARTSWRLSWRFGPVDPLLIWLAFDGMGFHAGYFHPHAAIERQRLPSGLRGYARNAHDQGLGRAIWFARGADVARVSRAVHAFSCDRQADLWSGVGLAAAYAGGVETGELRELRFAAGAHRCHLGQGAAFAAKARQRAGNPAAHTDSACRAFCGLPGEAAARITDLALNELRTEPVPYAVDARLALQSSKASSTAQPENYERWRMLIRHALTQRGEERG